MTGILGSLAALAPEDDEGPLRSRPGAPALDFVFAEQSFEGARPVYGGRLGVDATWKEGYPLPVTMPEEVVKLVDRRWGEYFPAGGWR